MQLVLILLNISLGTILVLCVLDYVTTVKIISAGGRETTAIVRPFQEKLGLRFGTFVSKLVVALAAAALYFCLPHWAALILLVIGIPFQAKAVIHNFGQMK